MKPIRKQTMGIYPFGDTDAQIVTRPGRGGEFWLCPTKGRSIRVQVGLDGTWSDVVTALLHECFEAQMARLGHRFDPTNDFGNDHASYVFIMTHPQFSNVCARVAQCMAAALPDLAKRYNRTVKKP